MRRECVGRRARPEAHAAMAEAFDARGSFWTWAPWCATAARTAKIGLRNLAGTLLGRFSKARR